MKPFYRKIEDIKQDYKQGDQVFIHSLDNTGNEYRATICGIGIDNVIKHYIVAPLNPQAQGLNLFDFTHTCVPSSCLKPVFS